MATDRQIAANRANCRRSTGPKTAAGQSKSSRNAFRHGLSLPLSADPQTQANIQAVAGAVAGDRATPDQLTVAMELAEAQLELVRIRAARAEAASSVNVSDEALNPRSVRRLCAFDRYERRARTKRKYAARELDQLTSANEGADSEKAQDQRDSAPNH